MATFVLIFYIYVLTALHFKSAATHCKSVLKCVSIFNKLQQIRLSSTSLSMLQPSAAVTRANNNEDNGLKIQDMFQDKGVFDL